MSFSGTVTYCSIPTILLILCLFIYLWAKRVVSPHFMSANTEGQGSQLSSLGLKRSFHVENCCALSKWLKAELLFAATWGSPLLGPAIGTVPGSVLLHLLPALPTAAVLWPGQARDNELHNDTQLPVHLEGATAAWKGEYKQLSHDNLLFPLTSPPLTTEKTNILPNKWHRSSFTS